MGPVYYITLRQLTGRGRLFIIALVAAVPLLITTLMLRSDSAATVGEFDRAILGALLAGSAAPLVVLALAGAAFANEIEDRTLANLTLAPVARWQIVVPKLLAAITIAAPFIGLSALLTGWIAYLGDPTAVIAITAGAVAGVALYASAFLFLGLLTTHAIGIGLVYIVLWEGFLAGFVSGVRMLSVRHHAIAIMHWLDPRRFAESEPLAAGFALPAAMLVFGGFVFLAVRRLRRMDVP